MPAGSVVIDLLARTGSFVTDIDRATKQAEKRVADFQRAVKASFAGNLLAGFAQEAISRIVALPGEVLRGIDALNDVADATGSSIEKISALEDVALRTGSSFESVTGLLVKFNAQLSGVDEDNKAGKVLKAIGLDIEQLRRMDPADAVLQVAKALDQFADDQNKAAIVQQLFGKSIREVAPLLHDLADKERLVGTVSTQQAKEVEAFNQSLARAGKNTLDLARYLSQDLITGINAAVEALQRGGLSEAIFTLFTGTDKYKAEKAIADLTGQLLTDQNELQRLLAGHANAQQVETQRAIVRGLEERIAKQRELLALTDPNYFKGKTTEVKPAAPRVDTGKEPKGAKGKDPDDDFKQYLRQLDQQIAKTDQLTAVEKLQYEVEHGLLSLNPAKKADQLAILTARAGELEADKEAWRVARERQAQRNKDNEEAVQGAREIEQAERDRLRVLLDAGPEAQLEKERQKLDVLNKALEAGTINWTQFNDAAGALHIATDTAKETKSIMDELGASFSSAAEDAVVNLRGVSDVMRGLGQDVARVVLRLGVMEPLLKRIKDAMSSSSGPGTGGGGWFESLLRIGGQALASAFGAPTVNTGTATGGDLDLFYGGQMAGGGNVFPGGAYTVGESGRRELFVPTSAGRVVPVDDSGAGSLGGGGWNVSVVNQTQGTVDRVVPQQLSPRDMVFVLQQTRKMVAGDMRDRNSDIHRATASSLRGRA